MSIPLIEVLAGIGTAGAVEDITDRFQSINISRGRTNELDQFNAGTCTVKFRNHDRHLDPLYTGSPYPNVVPGASLEIVAAGVTIYTGQIEDWAYDNPLGAMPYATARAVDALASLAATDSDEWTTTNGDLPGARIDAVLDRPEVAWAGSRDIDDGVFVLQGDSVSYGSNVLRYLQFVAKSDVGLFFASRLNVPTFRDRHAFINATPSLTFADDGTGSTFHGVAPDFGAERLHNDIAVDRDGGELQRVSDSTSIAAYGGKPRTLSMTGLLLQDDVQSLDLATYVLSVYKDPKYRLRQLKIVVSALDDADHADVLASDIADVQRVVWTPGAPAVGDPIDVTTVVEHVAHRITGSRHEMVLTLNDAAILQTGNYWTVEDPTYGVFDAYPVAF